MVIRILCAAAVLLYVLTASLPSSAQPVTTDPLGTDEAREIDALFRNGLAALRFAERQVDLEAREALLDEAIESFRAILIHRPGLVRVRLELARAFFLKGEDSLARRHFEQVLAGELPPPVIANINRFLGIMRSRRRWEAHVGFAIAPDSNLNTASEETTIWLDTPFGRLPFVRQGDIAPRSGIGVSVWGGGEYQYPLGERVRLRAGANASAREYKNRDFDQHTVSVHVGPRWLLGPRTEASVLATIRREWTAGQPETDQYGMRLEAAHRLTSRLNLRGRVGLRQRNSRSSDRLDGPVGDASLGVSWVALPVLRLSGNVGYSWARAMEEAWRNAGPEARLGGTLALPRGFSVGAQAGMQWTNYEGSGALHRTIDQEPRGDRRRTLSVSGHNRAVTVLGFSPRLSLINEKRSTNAQGLDYKRNRAEISFVRQF